MSEYVPPKYDLTPLRREWVDGELYLNADDLIEVLTDYSRQRDLDVADILNEHGLMSIPLVARMVDDSSSVLNVAASVKAWKNQDQFEQIVGEE